jgi:WD40 repeat protein
VHTAAFSPDGTRVVTASADHTARVWRSDGTGAPVVLRHDGEVMTAAFSPDGTRVVTASWDGRARMWECCAELKDLIAIARERVQIALKPDQEQQFGLVNFGATGGGSLSTSREKPADHYSR